MSDTTALFRRLYAAFNARDLERVLETLDPDVEWANGRDGGVVVGRAAVRDHWTGQFATTNPKVEPLLVSQEADGRTADLVLFDGRPAPTRGLRQTQAGLKVEWPRQRLGFTVEGFALRQFDTLQDSSRLGGNGFFALPGRDVDGLEAELAGRPLPWLDLRFGLTLMRAHDTAPVPDTTTPRGVEVPGVGVPARSLQLLARCVLPTDGEATHAVGTVFQAYSRRWAVAPDPFNNTRGLQLPGGARLDLSWTRSAGPWSLGLAVQNVFDRVLYSGQAAPDYIPLEPQRRWVLSARYAN